MNRCECCIQLDDVSFSYGAEVILSNITFSICKGDYIGIVGPNGGGKSTFVKLILGLLKPSSGKIVLYGENIQKSHHRSDLGYVPQRAAETLYSFPATIAEIVENQEALELCGINHLKDKLIGDLSGGERQKVFIARALAGNPHILILDEPVAGVDIKSQEEFYNFLRFLNEDRGITIIFVSHDIDIIAKEAKCILCLNKKIICHGHPDKMMTKENLKLLYGDRVHFLTHEHTTHA